MWMHKHHGGYTAASIKGNPVYFLAREAVQDQDRSRVNCFMFRTFFVCLFLFFSTSNCLFSLHSCFFFLCSCLIFSYVPFFLFYHSVWLIFSVFIYLLSLLFCFFVYSFICCFFINVFVYLHCLYFFRLHPFFLLLLNLSKHLCHCLFVCSFIFIDSLA